MFTGYNLISTIGKVLAVTSLVSILVYVVIENPKRSSLPRAFVWVLSIYLLFTTTVHPWYVLPLLAYSVFTHLRFAWLWSALIFLTYVGYTATGYTENLGLVVLEYLGVASLLIWEVRTKTKKPPKNQTSYLVVSDTATLREQP